jgi:transcription antitermination factor NusG
MITTAGGKEQTVIESLRNRVISESLQDTISELKIALATYYTKTGKAKIKNIYPGYAFIKMNMTNKA